MKKIKRIVMSIAVVCMSFSFGCMGFVPSMASSSSSAQSEISGVSTEGVGESSTESSSEESVGASSTESSSEESVQSSTYNESTEESSVEDSSTESSAEESSLIESSVEESSTESSAEESSVEENSSGSTSSVEDSSAEEEIKQPTEGIIYTLSEDGTYYTVTGYRGTETDVVIADVYNDLPVMTIGSGAFQNCTSLTSVDIGDSVTTIGEVAFSGCTSLTSVVIPDSVETIGEGAFSWCTSLTFNEYDNCKYLGNENNPYLALIETMSNDLSNCTVHADTKIIAPYAFQNCTGLTSVAIGDSVTSIGSGAFAYCDSLTEIVIPDSVTTIGSSAFEGCTGLTSVVIPDSVTTIGDSAFRHCTGLTIYCEAVSKPNGWNPSWNSWNSSYSYCPVVWDCNNNDVADDGYIYTVIDGLRYGITDGEAAVVRQLSNIVTANIPSSVTYKDAAYSVTSIGSSAFMYCTSLTSVEIGDGVTSIGNYAFEYCTSLMSVVIPDSVETIGSGVFENCTSLTFNEYDNCKYLGNENNPYLALIETTSNDLSNCTVHADTKIIASYAFYNCTSLTSVVIGDSVTSIGDWAFYECTSLTSVVIGDSVTSIGSGAFYECTSLTEIEIPDSVTTIGYRAFYECTSLTEIVIPDSVETIGYGAFAYCDSLTNITVDEENTAYKSIDGSLYNKEGTELIQYAIGKTNTTFTVPDSVETIGERAFSSCSSLTSVDIGDSVTTIDNAAFYDCTGLTSVVIGDSVTTIGNYAFYGCTGLTDVYYKGTAAEWSAIGIGSSSSSNIKLTSATRYYYIENEADVPTDGGNYWHYDENGEIAVW